MIDVRELRQGENPPAQGRWILVEQEGPVWVVNSASPAGDTVFSDPLGPFHTLSDAVGAALDLAKSAGFEVVYTRGAA